MAVCLLAQPSPQNQRKISYYSPLECDGEQFGVLPGEVVVVSETNLTKN